MAGVLNGFPPQASIIAAVCMYAWFSCWLRAVRLRNAVQSYSTAANTNTAAATATTATVASTAGTEVTDFMIMMIRYYDMLLIVLIMIRSSTQLLVIHSVIQT